MPQLNKPLNFIIMDTTNQIFTVNNLFVIAILYKGSASYSWHVFTDKKLAIRYATNLLEVLADDVYVVSLQDAITKPADSYFQPFLDKK